MKFNMNAERYSIEQQKNCVSTPESNVSVLTELEEGNNYFIFISFVHSPQMSNNLFGQGSSQSVLEACSRRSTIQSKTGANFSQVSETTFWTEVCLFKFSEINSMRHSEIPQNHFVKFIFRNFKINKRKTFVKFS